MHFISIHKIYPTSTLAMLYKDQIVRLRGVPHEIISNRDPRFTSSFYRSFQREHGMEAKFNIAYQPQINDQPMRTIQILEDLFYSCMKAFGGSYEHLLLVDFAYSNNYLASIGMGPFKALYGTPCRSLTCSLEGSEPLTVGPKFLQDSQRASI